MPCPHPMTTLSAAHILASWVQAHGTFPTQDECRTHNGLMHYVTIYKLFAGSSLRARISAALELPGAWETPSLKRRPCLSVECTVTFETTPDVRFCPRCRARREREHGESEYDMPILRRAQLQRWGVGRADWDQEVEW